MVDDDHMTPQPRRRRPMRRSPGRRHRHRRRLTQRHRRARHSGRRPAPDVSGVCRIEGSTPPTYRPASPARSRLPIPGPTCPPARSQHLPRAAALALAAVDRGAGPTPSSTRPRMALEQRRDFGVVRRTAAAQAGVHRASVPEYYSRQPQVGQPLHDPLLDPRFDQQRDCPWIDLRGPSHVISTGCTSSTDALGHAFVADPLRPSRSRLAGGTDAPFAPGSCRFLPDEDHDDIVERRTRTRLPPLFGRPRRLRARRGLLDAGAGSPRDGAASAARPIYGELRWLRRDLRGIPPRAAGRVRRGTREGDGVSRWSDAGLDADRQSTTSTCTAPRPS